MAYRPLEEHQYARAHRRTREEPVVSYVLDLLASDMVND